MLNFICSTGGRELYFKGKNSVRDCAVRAIAIATGKDYKEVYDDIARLNKEMKLSKKEKEFALKHTPRNGVLKKVSKEYLTRLGWQWIPCMGIGTGCTMHLSAHDFPTSGTYIVQVSSHLTCVKDGVIHDTFDCSRGGTRCVYGYWKAPEQK